MSAIQRISTFMAKSQVPAPFLARPIQAERFERLGHVQAADIDGSMRYDAQNNRVEGVTVRISSRALLCAMDPNARPYRRCPRRAMAGF